MSTNAEMCDRECSLYMQCLLLNCNSTFCSWLQGYHKAGTGRPFICESRVPADIESISTGSAQNRRLAVLWRTGAIGLFG